MKLLLLLLGLIVLSTISMVSAGGHGKHKNSTDVGYFGNEVEDYNYHPYQCGPNDKCKLGEVCHRITKGGYCKCVPIPGFKDICLSSKTINTWQDGSRGGCTYSQYDITIENHSDRNIKEIFIGSDYTLRLRDQSVSASLWNMVRLPKGILVLPSYQQSINAHASYTFGFIIEGARPANLHILSVLFE